MRPEPATETVEQIERSMGRAMAVPFDVTDADAVSAGMELVKTKFGPIDILVNVAGTPLSGGRMGLFKDSDPAKWRQWIDINLSGSMHCIRIVLPRMVERG